MYKNMQEYVEETLFKDVFSAKKPTKISPKLTMDNFIPDKKFAKEFKDMYADRIQTVFGCSGRNLKNLTVLEIIDYLAKQKENHAKFGNRPFKRTRG